MDVRNNLQITFLVRGAIEGLSQHIAEFFEEFTPPFMISNR
jgi:hypothetical protein